MTEALARQTPKSIFIDALEKASGEIVKALPDVITPERFLRIARSSVLGDGKLLKCTPESLIQSIVEAAQLGLPTDSTLGLAYLVPYKDTATLVIGYKGLIALARRSGEVKGFRAEIVREGDEFRYELGLNPDLVHIPADESERGDITYAYAVAKVREGGEWEPQFAVMSRTEIDLARNASAASGGGPWKDWYGEMAKKTVIKRLCKLLPISTDFAEVIARDEQREYVDVPFREARKTPELSFGNKSVVDGDEARNGDEE